LTITGSLSGGQHRCVLALVHSYIGALLHWSSEN
jgi:hypothetical protein